MYVIPGTCADMLNKQHSDAKVIVDKNFNQEYGAGSNSLWLFLYTNLSKNRVFLFVILEAFILCGSI